MFVLASVSSIFETSTFSLLVADRHVVDDLDARALLDVEDDVLAHDAVVVRLVDDLDPQVVEEARVARGSRSRPGSESSLYGAQWSWLGSRPRRLDVVVVGLLRDDRLVRPGWATSLHAPQQRRRPGGRQLGRAPGTARPGPRPGRPAQAAGTATAAAARQRTRLITIASHWLRHEPRRHGVGDPARRSGAPASDGLDGDRQPPAGLVLAGRAPGERAVVQVDLDDARPQLPADELLGERVLDVALNRPAQRPRAVGPVAARRVDDPVDRPRAAPRCCSCRSARCWFRLPMSSRVIRRRSSSDSGSNTMISSTRLMNSGLNVRFTSPSTMSVTDFWISRASGVWKPIDAFFWMKRAPMFDVMMRIVFLKLTRLPEPVGQMAVLEDLQQDVEQVRVRLLDLVEQDDRVRVALDLLGELTALFVPDVAGRRADQLRDRVLLHVLGHVEADERVVAAEEEVRQRARQLRLADAGRPEEDEAADRAAVGFLSPARDRRMARDSAEIAFSWLITRRCSSSSIRRSLSPSSSFTDVSGTPVHFETTSSISVLADGDARRAATCTSSRSRTTCRLSRAGSSWSR